MSDSFHSICTRRGATTLLLSVVICVLWWGAVALPDRPASLAFYDELHYWQQARDISEGSVPRYNRIWSAKYPPLYGAVLAPFRYFGSCSSFSWWSRFANLLLAVSSLIPAYRLARIFYSRGIAVAIAIIALTGPFQIYCGLLMSENLFVPLVLWLAVVLARLVDKPTIGRAALLGVVLGLATLTKTLAILMLPAITVALFWARRDVWRTLRTVAACSIAAGIVIAPWELRALLPSESGVRVLGNFSYWSEFSYSGVRPFGRYAFWAACSLGNWARALGPVTLALGVAGLSGVLFSRRPKHRVFAAFAVLIGLGYTLFSSIWVAQIEFYKAVTHERYLVFVFPLVVLAFPMAILDRRRRPVWIGALVLAAIVLLMPDVMFDPKSPVNALLDSPSYVLLAHELGELMSPLWIRAGLIAALSLIWIAGFGRRPAGVVLAILLSVAFGYQVLATTAAVKHHARVDADLARSVDEVEEWFAGNLRPGDACIFYKRMGNMAYFLSQLNELDYNVLGADLRAELFSNFMVNNRKEIMFLPGVRASRTLLLTCGFVQFDLPVVSQHRHYRLYEVDGPVEDNSVLRTDGIWIDRKCAPRVKIEHPCPAGRAVTVRVSIHHPVHGPVRAPVLRVRVLHGDETSEVLVKRGETVSWEGKVLSVAGKVELTIETDQWAYLVDRPVAYELAGFAVIAIE